jgi:hypothetical protein
LEINLFKPPNGRLAAVLGGIWPLLSTANLPKSHVVLKLTYFLAKAARASRRLSKS